MKMPPELIHPFAKTVAALQPHYFPSVMDAVRGALAPVILFADHLQVPRQSRVTRVVFPVSPRPFRLVVPIHYHRKQSIAQTRVDYHHNWQRQHQEALRHFFHHMPYFDGFYWDVATVLQDPPQYLGDLFVKIWQATHQRLFPATPWYRTAHLQLWTPAAIRGWLKQKGMSTFLVTPEEVPYYQALFPHHPLIVVELPQIVAEFDGMTISPQHPLLMGLWFKGPAFLKHCIEQAQFRRLGTLK